MTNRNLTNWDKEAAKSLTRIDIAVKVSKNYNKQSHILDISIEFVEHTGLFILFIVPLFGTNRPKQLDYPSVWMLGLYNQSQLNGQQVILLWIHPSLIISLLPEILHDLRIPSAYEMTIFHKLSVRTECIMADKKITNQISQFAYSEFS